MSKKYKVEAILISGLRTRLTDTEIQDLRSVFVALRTVYNCKTGEIAVNNVSTLPRKKMHKVPKDRKIPDIVQTFPFLLAARQNQVALHG